MEQITAVIQALKASEYTWPGAVGTAQDGLNPNSDLMCALLITWLKIALTKKFR